jgi:hypothetical protein
MCFFPDMPGASPGRIDGDLVAEPGLIHHILEDSIGHRRTADIARTDKQDTDHPSISWKYDA